MNSVRIFFTEECNAKCPNCLNKTFRRDKLYIDKAKYILLCDYLSRNNIKGVKIMGGEPSLHPDFEELLSVSQHYFQRVSVFTNGIADAIEKFKPRKEDGISYNFRFNKELTKSKLLLSHLGYRSLEVLVERNSNIEELSNQIQSVNALAPDRMTVMLTLDCTNAIFKEREEVLPKFESLFTKLQQDGVNVRIDHSLPICYVYGTKIPIYAKGSLCDTDCAGLIDSDFNLRYCNQHSEILVNLFSDERIIPFRIFENHLNSVFYRNQAYVLEKLCKNCLFFNNMCNGGCFVASKLNKKEDIISNTNLPVT